MKPESLKMNLQSLKSRVNNRKGWLINEKSMKIAAAFVQNKANTRLSSNVALGDPASKQLSNPELSGDKKPDV